MWFAILAVTLLLVQETLTSHKTMASASSGYDYR